MRITMRANLRRRRSAAVLILAFTSVLASARAQDLGATNGFVGTWVLVGTPDEIGQAPAAGASLKILTATNWSDVQADPETGTTNFSHGGTWSIHGHTYTETVTHATKHLQPLVGKSFRFDYKLDKDMLTLVGDGNPWKEVWKRADLDSLLNTPKADASDLQGTWSGNEKDSDTKTSVSLAIKANSIEFHGAGSHDWYKGRFTAYETKPKQLVIVITNCPDRSLIGSTCNSIYQIRDGTLTLTGYEPDNPTAPADFSASGARTFEFRKR